MDGASREETGRVGDLLGDRRGQACEFKFLW